MLKTKTSYIGIDETTVGIERSSIVVAAFTDDLTLAEYRGYRKLKKAKDLTPNLPSYDELVGKGLQGFYWMRVSNGRFSRQLMQHACIAHMIASNGFDPGNTRILVDNFHSNHCQSNFLIYDYLHQMGFNIPYENVQLVGDGDRSVPIINFADILAHSIGLHMNERYRKHFPERMDFGPAPKDFEYDPQRISSVEPAGRQKLEQVLRRWKGTGKTDA